MLVYIEADISNVILMGMKYDDTTFKEFGVRYSIGAQYFVLRSTS